MTTDRARIGSLFSGYGGLDLAVESVFGATTAWVADIDPGPRKILAHRFPHAPNLGDVTAVDWAKVEPVDIIAGGYPCQPFSQAGRRQGQADARHLWPHVADILAIMRPSLVVFENVRGHLSLGFDEVVRDLHQLGYDIQWTLLRASDIGACHQRARLFILGVERERRVCGRPDRRGGLDRHSANHVQLPGADANHDVGQGHSGAASDAWSLRRSNRTSQGGTGEPSSVDLLDHLGGSGRGSDWPSATSPDRQERAGSYSSRFSLNVDGRTHAAESGARVDGMYARTGAHVDAADSGSQQAGSRSGGSDAARRPAVCGLPVGLVVGAGGEPVRSSGVRGAVPDERNDGGGTRLRPDLTLLPTPTSRDWKDGAYVEGVPENALLGRVVWQLLPTPTAQAAKHAGDDRGPGTLDDGNLWSVATRTDRWGDYAAAIHRHERMLGRPAPSPTEPGRNGNPRLSAAFTEWMMCLPAGWVTDTPGITRSEALKALGNGVIPLQAVAALQDMHATLYRKADREVLDD